MPVPPGAIDHPMPIAILLAPARPLPAAPQHPQTTRPQTGEASGPLVQALQKNSTAEVRGPIASTATVGGPAAHIGAPGVLGIAVQNAQVAKQDAFEAIGRHVDRRA